MKSRRLKQLYFITLLLISLCTKAQWYNPEKVDKKLGYKYGSALNAAKERNYDEALRLLDACIADDNRFVDAWLSKGGILSERKKYKPSIESFKYAFQLDSVYSSNYLLPYSIALAGNGDFASAKNAVTQFLTKKNLNDRIIKSAQYRLGCYNFALEYQKQFNLSGYVFAPINLGDSINTNFLEYLPSITVEGNELLFTKRVNNSNEDFFISKKKNGQWSKAIPLPGELNTSVNEGAPSISQDGKQIVFAANYGNEGEGNFDIYTSFRNKNGWGPKINLGRNINTEYWETQPCLSPDKKTLYFVASDPSGLGGSDLYISTLQPNNRWSEARNMGPGINTNADEGSPFIHADNQTLFFTSKGHPGYGGNDVFMVRKQSDGSWSKPLNLGYPVNTIDEEGGLIIASDAKTVYFSSDGWDSRGGLDIFSFELPAHIRPFKTLWVKGTVFDKKTKQGLPSSVELIDLATAQTISNVQTDEEGNYLITLPVGKNYAFNVNRKGYLFFSESFMLMQKENDSAYNINIPLTPIEINASIVLKNIFFDTKKSELKPESLIELDKVVQLLRDNPSIKIEISGHTDNVGKPGDNLILSNKRSKAVINYLLSKSIAASRLSFKGWGATRPVADNKTEEGRARNRRTELKVLSK
jgi:outer membrane protein OmpA-like peptidoglycan-associated protein/tetratricopeptide (TPR) repeat protein